MPTVGGGQPGNGLKRAPTRTGPPYPSQSSINANGARLVPPRSPIEHGDERDCPPPSRRVGAPVAGYDKSRLNERVVLLDEQGHAIGSAPKAAVHSRHTPLHLAFSCYLANADGYMLLTRRAPSKKTWPGVWTNSCCGHPAPGEPLTDAIHRRLREELGVRADRIEVILPRYRYRAVMVDGIVENEICPVVRALVTGDITRNSHEVAEAHWVSWAAFTNLAQDCSHQVSPWCRDQVTQLATLGDDIRHWPAANRSELPAAVRHPLKK